jgi:hypothetical protein
VLGSRSYCDPAAYLLTPAQWAGQRDEFCRLVGKPADATTGLAEVADELHTALVAKSARSRDHRALPGAALPGQPGRNGAGHPDHHPNRQPLGGGEEYRCVPS